MSSYNGVKAVVTGGLGFIGSNLAIRLVNEGAQVTILDSLLPGCGGKWINIEPIRTSATVVVGDIGEMAGQAVCAIAEADVIFNLAGEISHIHSMQFPERDLQVNTVSQLRFLLECTRLNRGVRIVYAGTRQVYGVPQYLPIDEAHPIQPVDFNGVHKYAAAMYHRMLSRSGDVNAVVLRLTNVYGPRMAVDIGCQGFFSNFVRRALLNQPIEVFGDGLQYRDPVYIDDVVEAFLRAGEASEHTGTYNTGADEVVTLIDIARTIAKQAGSPEPVLLPFPEERKAIDIGSYSTNSGRIRKELGWKATTNLESGVRCTITYFRRHLAYYLDPSEPLRPCPMPEHSGEPHRLRYGALE
jgi:UDP-glucose 4-epimerase